MHPDVITCLDFLNDVPRNAWYSRQLSRLVSGKRVFEVGCGVGILGAFCLQHGATWYGAIDVRSSRSEITDRVLRDMGYQNIELYSGDFLTWTNPQGHEPDIVITERIGNEFANDLKMLKVWQHAKAVFPKCQQFLPDTWAVDVEVYDGDISSDFLACHAPHRLVSEDCLPLGYASSLQKTNMIQPRVCYQNALSIQAVAADQPPRFNIDRGSTGISTLVISDNICHGSDACVSVSALRDWKPQRVLVPPGPAQVQVYWQQGWQIGYANHDQ